MKLVLDTNVVVSGLVGTGPPSTLMQAAALGEPLLVTSPALIVELSRVIARKKFASRLQGRRLTVDQSLALYVALAQTVFPSDVPRLVPADVDDDQVIAAAVAAGADIVVTGDGHLLELRALAGMDILSPSEALARLAR